MGNAMNKLTGAARRLLLAGAVVLASIWFLVPANPNRSVVLAAGQMGMPCTLQTVAGAYAFSGQGFLAFGTPQQVQAAETGVATADGAGNLAGTVTFSMSGNILRTPFTATYNMNSDCTISEVISFGTQAMHQEGIIVPEGREINFIQTDPGPVLTRVAKRDSTQQ